MSNEKLTRGDERTSPLDQVFQPGLGGKEERERESKWKREGKCGIFRERSSTFSLEFSVTGPASFDEARSKVAPHGKDYTWVPVLGSFDKL